MDVYKSTANSLSLVAGVLSGQNIDTGFNNSSVPNFGQQQTTQEQPKIQPDGQTYETSIYNPYNSYVPVTQTETKPTTDLYPIILGTGAAILVAILLRR